MFKYVFLFASMLALFSCKEEPPVATVGSTTVTITVHTPESLFTIQDDQMIHLEALIDADAKLGGWKAFLHDSDGNLINEYEDHYQQTQYIVHHHWLANFVENTMHLTITLQALTVSGEIIQEIEIPFTCEP